MARECAPVGLAHPSPLVSFILLLSRSLAPGANNDPEPATYAALDRRKLVGLEPAEGPHQPREWHGDNALRVEPTGLQE
jgi:hypothetical protein